jgi:hypothetical protein
LNDDPYELLPAQPGVGKIIMAARPQVIPVLSPDSATICRNRFWETGRAAKKCALVRRAARFVGILRKIATASERTRKSPIF